MIIVRGFAGIVEQAGADNVVGRFSRGEADIEAGENRQIALRAEMEYPLARAAFDDATGGVARADDGVIGVARDRKPIEYASHRGARPRRVGNKNDRSARRAKSLQSVASSW